MSLLRTEKLYKDFSGLAVLMGIDLEIKQGERHAIIGPNGAGKSTFYNIITGKYKPSRGKIFFKDHDITGKPPHAIARMGIARSFQIINIFPKMTVYENVRNAIVSKFNKRFNWFSILSRDDIVREETERILEMLKLSHRRNSRANVMSYGEQRELEIALTLATNPELIMLDEPTAGLNTEETHRAVELIRRVTEGKTLVVVEHDMNVVFNLADRITVLYYGEILASGPPDEIRNSNDVKKAYLGSKRQHALGNV